MARARRKKGTEMRITGTQTDGPLHQEMLGDLGAERAVNASAVEAAVARGMDRARAEEVYGPRRDHTPAD